LISNVVFSRFGKLDVSIMAVLDHTDLSLVVRSNGGQVFFEPESVVTYIPAPPRLRELPFFMFRWSQRGARNSHQSFLAKWTAEEGKPHYTCVDFVRDYRGNGMPKIRKRLLEWFGWRVGNSVVIGIEWVLSQWGFLNSADPNSSPHYKVVHCGGGR
jgi:hypothetical protein